MSREFESVYTQCPNCNKTLPYEIRNPECLEYAYCDPCFRAFAKERIYALRTMRRPEMMVTGRPIKAQDIFPNRFKPVTGDE